MAIIGLTGAPVHSGSWLGLPDIGLTEFLQGKKTTTPSNTGLSSTSGTPSQMPSFTTNQNAPAVDYNAAINNPGLKVNSNVLGAGTSTQAPSNTGGGGGGGGGAGGGGVSQGDLLSKFPGYRGWDPNVAWNDYLSTGGAGKSYGDLQGEITGGWDRYLGSLDEQIGGLESQRRSQEDIARSQQQQGLNTLGLQREQGLSQLGTERNRIEQNQQKTLRDLSSNLRNSFMAGNIYLGARGAGDSSAANQYALALTKEGSRQRGDVMAQGADQQMEIGRREQDLNNVYNTEVKNLEEGANQAISGIAQWFANAQNQVRQMQAQGQLSKSQDLASLSKDILNQAISQMNTINQEVSNRRNALESWAISQSKNISDLKSNLQNISQFTANIPGYQQIAGTPQVDSTGNIRVQTGYGTNTGKRWDPIRQQYV